MMLGRVMVAPTLSCSISLNIVGPLSLMDCIHARPCAYSIICKLERVNKLKGLLGFQKLRGGKLGQGTRALHLEENAETVKQTAQQVIVAPTRASVHEKLVLHGPIQYQRLMPCPPQILPPRIEHMLVEQDGNVVDLISHALTLPPLYVADLIEVGAVHYALECPTPPLSASPEQLELFDKFAHFRKSLKKIRPSLKGKTLREAQKTFRIASEHEIVEAGTYLRVHVHPKRFPRVYEVDWLSRIIAETDSYVVVDKPAGVTVGGTVDNLEEMCATFVGRALGLQHPLILTHQIDGCTEGCVVFAKTRQFSSHFHKLLRERKVKKEYRALAAAPVSHGRHSHFMRPDRYAPRILSEKSYERWFHCLLEVLDCKQVPWPGSALEAQYGIEDCGWDPRLHAYECPIHLLTGRTHQVRAQFAALGAPLVGDSVYMPAAAARLKSPEIDPFLAGLSAQDDNTPMSDSMTTAEENWIAQHGPEPKCAVGLQASVLAWEGEDRIFKAGPPWWHQT